MGFLYLAIVIPKAITISFLLNIFSRARFVVIGLLTRLGIYKPPPEEDSSYPPRDNYILILDGPCPSLVPIPVSVVTAAIKHKVPILLFEDFVRRHREEEEEEEEGGGVSLSNSKVCSICLEDMEGRHEMRELCNCDHVFHRVCLDTWIDEGQVTCPLCRSMLLPPKTNLTRCNDQNYLPQNLM